MLNIQIVNFQYILKSLNKLKNKVQKLQLEIGKNLP